MKLSSPTLRDLLVPSRATSVRAPGEEARSAGTARHHGLALGVILGVSVATIGLGGCSKTSSNPGAKDPEQQSIAEHDLAADALQKGSLRTALVHAKKAIELDEANYNAQLLAANIYLGFCANSPDECRLDEAERHAREALKHKADFGDATNTLGVILTHEKKYSEAISTLKPLTENMLYNTPELAWGNLGLAYLEKGEIDPAIVALKRAVALQPAFCVGSYRLGLAYEKKGDARAAERALSSCLDTAFEQCRFPEAYEARARVLTKLGEAGAARLDLDRCRKVGEGTPIGKRCETLSLGGGQRP